MDCFRLVLCGFAPISEWNLSSSKPLIPLFCYFYSAVRGHLTYNKRIGEHERCVLCLTETDKRGSLHRQRTRYSYHTWWLFSVLFWFRFFLVYFSFYYIEKIKFVEETGRNTAKTTLFLYVRRIVLLLRDLWRHLPECIK